ncbi:hypothetical protein COL922a_013588 [Colletotrichum nupharicola]|nr:hypothetical protein COL922a_013588 [Colletotrichum nupharicola]
MEQAKILVVGCGPVGTMCAFALQESGQATVTVILRSNFDLVKSQGFRIQSVDHGEIDSWRPRNIERTVHDSLQHGPFDYVVVALKNLPDVYSIPNIIAPAVTLDRTSIVLVQNGIDIEQPFVDAFPKTILLSGVPMIGCELNGRELLHNDPDILQISAFPFQSQGKSRDSCVSMQVDAIRGRPMEIEVILGNPIRTARRFGVATPTLVVLYNLLKAKQWQFIAGR